MIEGKYLCNFTIQLPTCLVSTSIGMLDSCEAGVMPAPAGNNKASGRTSHATSRVASEDIGPDLPGSWNSQVTSTGNGYPEQRAILQRAN